MQPSIPDTSELLQSFGIALGLGLLVGLQREWEQNRVAGIRTFALISLFGVLCGLLGTLFGGWIIATAFLSFTALVALGHWTEMRRTNPDAGLTTEMAMLVMFATSIVATLGYRLIAVIIAGSVMVLLQSKKPLHQMVRRIGEDDLREIARFALIGLVILPLLPNRPMGYLGVLNPFSIWLMVVLIVGVSLTAYLLGKYFDGQKNNLIAGLLGGLISSTATTASMARRSHTPESSGLSLAAITLLASAIVFIRILIEVGFTAPGHLAQLLPPLVAMMLWFALVAIITHRLSQKSGPTQPEASPPSELKGAVIFGLLYALVLITVAIARQHFGQSGLYIAAALSGLTDMDAITLSTSGLVNSGHLDAPTAWRMILIGGLANIAFKMALASILGVKAFIRPVLLGFTVALAGGCLILLLWP